jgi:hypothetical protein
MSMHSVMMKFFILLPSSYVLDCTPPFVDWLARDSYKLSTEGGHLPNYVVNLSLETQESSKTQFCHSLACVPIDASSGCLSFLSGHFP